MELPVLAVVMLVVAEDVGDGGEADGGGACGG